MLCVMELHRDAPGSVTLGRAHRGKAAGSRSQTVRSPPEQSHSDRPFYHEPRMPVRPGFAGWRCGLRLNRPGTVPRDRVDYITAVAESWKEQTLLNVVRMRYGDAPSFVDVSSVISAYAFQGQVAAGGQISSNLTATIPSNLATLGGNATYLDRPTITYTPVTGDKFAKSLLRPIPPSAIFELIQAGYPADYILQMTTRAINGVYNRSSMAGGGREADPEFYPLLDALRRLQNSGAVSLRLEKHGADETGILILAGRRADRGGQ